MMNKLVSRYGLLWQLVLILLSGLIACSMLYAVEAQEATKKEAAAQAASPLELTAEEKKFRDAYLQELIPTRQAINALLEKQLLTDDEEKALGFWSRARGLYTSKLMPMSEKFNTWLVSVQKAHKCEGCNLQGDKLVPVPLPGQTPSGTN